MASPISFSSADLVEPGWSSLSGRVLEGGFELQELLEADEATARFKVRVLGDRDLDCVAQFYQAAGLEADEQVERWQFLRQMRHPNISAPLGAGRVRQDQIEAIFAVVRRADESLDGVLRERPLSVEEAGEVLVSSARALEALHLNGMVHGCLSPLRILAVGESIKLSSDCVCSADAKPPIRMPAAPYLAPESPEGNLTPAADVWCLGATLFETLTQKRWSEESREETGALPEPFASIALRCLHVDPEGRAALAEVVALQSGALKPVPRARPLVAETPAPLTVPETILEDQTVPRAAVGEKEELTAAAEPIEVDPYPFSPASEAMPGATALPIAAAFEEKPAAEENQFDAKNEAKETVPVVGHPSFDEAIRATPVRRRSSLDGEEVDEPNTNLWLFGGIALLVVLALIWILRPKPHTTPAVSTPSTGAATSSGTAVAPSGPAAPAAAKPAQGGSNNAWETRTLQPDGSAVKAGAGKNADEGPAVWRMVAFTYSQRKDAEKKVQTLNTKNRKLHAEVFSPSGNGAPFLVVVGGRMTKENAAQERKRAISSGLPRDSYIQNYNH